MKDKRCHYYDSRGQPRTLHRNGKPFSAILDHGQCKCRRIFAHPEDPEWAALPPVPAPSFLVGTPSPSPPPTAPKPSAIDPPVSTKVDNEKALLTLIELKSDYEVLSMQHRKLQQILDNTALMPQSFSSGQQLSRANIVSRRDALEKKMKEAYLRYQEREQNSPFQFQSIETTHESDITILKDLLQKLKLKLLEAESLKAEVERNMSRVEPAPTDLDGDIVMMDTSVAILKRKQPDSDSSLPPPITKYLVLLQNRLDQISRQVISVECDVTAQQEELKDIIRNSTHENVTPSEIVVDGLQQEIEHLDNELTELAAMTSEIIAEDDRLNSEYQRLQKDKEDQEVELKKLMGQLEKLQKEQEKDDSELSILSTALASYMERPISPPPSPFIPEDIVASLEEEIVPLIRSAIKPQIENLRSELAQEIMRQESEVYNTLSPIITATHQTINSISNATPSD